MVVIAIMTHVMVDVDVNVDVDVMVYVVIDVVVDIITHIRPGWNFLESSIGLTEPLLDPSSTKKYCCKYLLNTLTCSHKEK